MSKDVSLPFEAVGKAAATELTWKTLLCAARPGASAAGRWKDLWEMEFKQQIRFRRQSVLFMASVFKTRRNKQTKPNPGKKDNLNINYIINKNILPVPEYLSYFSKYCIL